VFVCCPEAQGQLVSATAAVERAVFITRHWLASTRPAARALYSTGEELRCQVKKMGGFLQLLIQVEEPGTKGDPKPVSVIHSFIHSV